MADNSVYWTDQSGWYQQPGPPPPPPQTSYQPTTPYSNQGPPIPNKLNNHASPSPQNQIQPSTQALAHQITSPQQPPPPPQQQHPPPPHPGQQHHQMIQNGVSNGNHNMQSNIQPGPPSQPMSQMNVYSPAPMNNMMNHNDPMNSAQPPHPMHQANSTGYPMHHHNSSYQSPQTQQPPPPAGPAYGQPNHSYSNSMPPQGASNPIVHQQQQGQPPQPSHSYPQQQYSPASYWHQGPMHLQSSYGPPPLNGTQGPPQNIATPPSALPDNSTNYHASGAPMPGPPHQPPPSHPIANQQQQQPPNMPYDNRGPSMPMNYNGPYQQQQPPPPPQNYYGPPDMQQHPTEPVNCAPDVSHQHQGWSNGYYQPSQSPYAGAMSSYPPPYNGSNANAPVGMNSVHGPHPPMMQHQQPPHPNHHYTPNMASPHPNQQPHSNAYQAYPQHPQQSQQLAHQNHNMKERKIAREKKPVKPRGPKKQKDPNAPTGRQKKPRVTEKTKKSAYAVFYQEKQRELGIKDFGNASTAIAEQWSQLTEAEKSVYIKEVATKRRALLRDEASQQAQNLLVQEMT